MASAVSPDGRNEIRLWRDPLRYEALRDGRTVVAQSCIGMAVDGKDLRPTDSGIVRSRRLEGIVPTSVYKKSSVDLSSDESVVDFGGWSVRILARNDGVAYRFESGKAGRVTVTGERADVRMPDPEARCWCHFTVADGCEETVGEACRVRDALTDGDKRRMIYLPFVYEANGKTVAVTETAVKDYPIWNMRHGEDRLGTLEAEFARWPGRVRRMQNDKDWNRIPVERGGRWIDVVNRADLLVETEGTRCFPWRVFVLADHPAGLFESDIVYALGDPPADGLDFSWVRPGKVAWDWWNDWGLEGVPFEAGCNTRTYEYYIDFAATNGLEYVILDEGWSENLNIWKFNPAVDVPHLIAYAAQKNVGIILWLSWAQAFGEEERVADYIAGLGAKGVKVDFIDRGDAEAERFAWRFADAAARRRLLVDLHGAHHPAGLNRTYPNVINFEGVHGLETMKFYKGEDILRNDVGLLFSRMTAGPLDYTPGAMDNFRVGDYPDCRSLEAAKAMYHSPGSLGTRARQMAMMILYEAPLRMLCDSPTKYERNEECLKVLSEVPTVWDDVRGLEGSPETFATLARRKGDVWYVAGIADASPRVAYVDFSFIGDGTAEGVLFCDADDAERMPMHYEVRRIAVTSRSRLRVEMKAGGGFMMKVAKRRMLQ